MSQYRKGTLNSTWHTVTTQCHLPAIISLPSSPITHFFHDNASLFSEHTKYSFLPTGLYAGCSLCPDLFCSLHGWFILSTNFNSSESSLVIFFFFLTTLSKVVTNKHQKRDNQRDHSLSLSCLTVFISCTKLAMIINLVYSFVFSHIVCLSYQIISSMKKQRPSDLCIIVFWA